MKWTPTLLLAALLASAAAQTLREAKPAQSSEVSAALPWKFVVIVAEPSPEAEELQAAVNSIPGVFVKAKFDSVLQAIFTAHQQVHKLNGNGYVRADRRIRLTEPIKSKPDWYNSFSIKDMDVQFLRLMTAFLSPSEEEAGGQRVQTVGYRETDTSSRAYEQLTSLMRLTDRTAAIFLDDSGAGEAGEQQRRTLRGRFDKLHKGSSYRLAKADVVNKSDHFKNLFAFLGAEYPTTETTEQFEL